MKLLLLLSMITLSTGAVSNDSTLFFELDEYRSTLKGDQRVMQILDARASVTVTTRGSLWNNYVIPSRCREENENSELKYFEVKQNLKVLTVGRRLRLNDLISAVKNNKKTLRNYFSRLCKLNTQATILVKGILLENQEEFYSEIIVDFEGKQPYLSVPGNKGQSKLILGDLNYINVEPSFHYYGELNWHQVWKSFNPKKSRPTRNF